MAKNISYSSSSSHDNAIHSTSGFCKSNSTFYSKRNPILLPSAHSLDVTTFISSRPHLGNLAFIDAVTDRRLTFSDVWRAVDSVSSSLSDLGIRKGHVVLILSPNSIFFPIVCLSVMSLGAVITTTNPLNTSREIGKQIADSKPVLAFTVPQLVSKLAESKSDLPIVLIGPNTNRVEEGARILTTLEEMMKIEPSQSRVRERVTQDDTASLLYSSGTTGDSKGVVSSHRNFIAMAQTIVNRYNLDAENLTFMCVLPMFHIYGMAAFVTGFLATGSTVVILPQFDLDDTLSAIDKYRATHLPLVPPILLALLNGADQIKQKYELSSLKYVVCGGAPLSKEVTEGFVEKYPEVGILQVYGLTESPMGASTESLEESRLYGTAGMLSASMEGKIVDPKSGKALPENQTGELWLRGPVVMKGYFNNAEATALTLDSEGWLKTGDLCFFDDSGFIFVVDRLKELIKYKGYQVPPAELEALLLTHPAIADAAVIPFPDREVGQYPMAYLVRKPETGNVSDKDVMEFVAKQVAPYKRIRRVSFVDFIPKNPSGKILRKDLIKLATSTSSKL